MRELPAVRRTQPITIGQNFFQQPMSNYYNGHKVNNINKRSWVDIFCNSNNLYIVYINCLDPILWCSYTVYTTSFYRSYLINFAIFLQVDAAFYGNLSHFINHSCDPNLSIFNVYINCLDPNLPQLCLFARRLIQLK